VLSDDELRLVWRATFKVGGKGDALHPYSPSGPLVRLLMITGQRLREAANVRRSADGSCWVRLNQNGRRGVLSAYHTVQPPFATPNQTVTLNVARAKGPGDLLCASINMDAAVVELGSKDWLGRTPVQSSSVIGFKPVRLLSSLGPRDGWTKELSGATIFGQPGQERRTQYSIIAPSKAGG
jgi:hypothetical protein